MQLGPAMRSLLLLEEVLEPGAALLRFRVVAVAHRGRIDGGGLDAGGVGVVQHVRHRRRRHDHHGMVDRARADRAATGSRAARTPPSAAGSPGRRGPDSCNRAGCRRSSPAMPALRGADDGDRGRGQHACGRPEHGFGRAVPRYRTHPGMPSHRPFFLGPPSRPVKGGAHGRVGKGAADASSLQRCKRPATALIVTVGKA